MGRVLGALLITVLFWSTACPAADASRWRTQPDVSELAFLVRYEGQELRGVFRRFDVDFVFDPARPESASLTVTVATGSADMNDREANAELTEPEWFHSGRFEESVFRSEKIRGTAEDGFVASGELKLKGNTGHLEVPFDWHRNGDRAEMSGELLMSRTRWDIGTGEWSSVDSLADAVKLRFQLELTREN